MFNNNINKPAMTVFLPLTSAKTSFCQWQKLVFASGKKYFCRDGFFRGKKTVFTSHWQKLANPAINYHVIAARPLDRLRLSSFHFIVMSV